MADIDWTGANEHRGVGRLEVDTDAAGIRIVAAPEGDDSTLVVVRDRAGTQRHDLLEIDQAGDLLRTRVRTVRSGRWRRNRAVDARVVVQVPRGAAVHARTDAGTVRVEDRDADVTVVATAGAVRLRGVRGRIDARSEAGAVKLVDTMGDATVTASAGAVRIDRHHGPQLHVTTAAGGVKATGLEVGTVVARADAGAVLLEFATPPVDVDVSCSVGSATVELPPEAYEVHAKVGGLGRASIEGIDSVPGADRRVAISTELGRIKVVGARVPTPA